MDEEPGLLARLDPALRLALARGSVGAVLLGVMNGLATFELAGLLVGALVGLVLAPLGWAERRVLEATLAPGRHLVAALGLGLLGALALAGALLQGVYTAGVISEGIRPGVGTLEPVVQLLRELPLSWYVVGLGTPGLAVASASYVRLRRSTRTPRAGTGPALLCLLLALVGALLSTGPRETATLAILGAVGAWLLLGFYALCDYFLHQAGAPLPARAHETAQRDE
ncbi:MAG: hypothetical protein AB7N76_27115 [Planctomycetota bacterium]